MKRRRAHPRANRAISPRSSSSCWSRVACSARERTTVEEMKLRPVNDHVAVDGYERTSVWNTSSNRAVSALRERSRRRTTTVESPWNDSDSSVRVGTRWRTTRWLRPARWAWRSLMTMTNTWNSSDSDRCWANSAGERDRRCPDAESAWNGYVHCHWRSRTTTTTEASTKEDWETVE